MKETDEKKDKITARQKNVENLLREGKHSATDITIKLRYADPRSYIRYLRDKGVNVRDEWVQKKDTRYKIYWIEPKQESPVATEATQQNSANLFERRHNYD